MSADPTRAGDPAGARPLYRTKSIACPRCAQQHNGIVLPDGGAVYVHCTRRGRKPPPERPGRRERVLLAADDRSMRACDTWYRAYEQDGRVVVEVCAPPPLLTAVPLPSKRAA